MQAPALILVNALSAGGTALGHARQLELLLAASGADARVEVVFNPREITPRARAAAMQGTALVVAAGGDGTVNAVVNGIAGTGAVLGVIPLGTLNHFAKDMGLPVDPAKAVAVLDAGRVATCDAGMVNGRLFVNNSSLGLYPSMVRRRQKQQKRGYRKWAATLLAVPTVLRNYSLLRVSLEVDGQRLIRRAPLVFIGNNEYLMQGFNMGERATLGAGILCLHVPHDLGPWELIGIGLRALAGRLRGVKNMDMLHAREILVKTRRKRLAVALDGEVEYVRPPLAYRCLPGAVRVMVP